MAAARKEPPCLSFGSPLLQPSFPGMGQVGNKPRRSREHMATCTSLVEPFSRIVGVECAWSFSDIRKRNVQRCEFDDTVAQLQREVPMRSDPLDVFGSAAAETAMLAEDNRSGARILVASTDADGSQTYVESMTLDALAGGERQLIVAFPGRRDIVHASMSTPGADGEVMVLFTERQHAVVDLESSFTYRLYVCAAKVPVAATSGASPNEALSAMLGSAQARPLGLMDITPKCPEASGEAADAANRRRGFSPYHVGYFIKLDDRKRPPTFLYVSDNTDFGMSLQQVMFTTKGSQSSIRLVTHDKWGLARKQFWHQWNPFTQQIMFAVHCGQFIKFRMIALGGSPDIRQPLFERNLAPSSLTLSQGNVPTPAFLSGNTTPSSSVHFVVLPIRYECGSDDYALCSQVVRRGHLVRHAKLLSHVVITVVLLRNGLKEGRFTLEVPRPARQRPTTDEEPGFVEEEWRAAFAVVRGAIAVIFPTGAVHFIDVAHKEQCPTYLFGSSSPIFSSSGVSAATLAAWNLASPERSPPMNAASSTAISSTHHSSSLLPVSVAGESPTTSNERLTASCFTPWVGTLQLIQSVFQSMRRLGSQPGSLGTLPLPIPNVLFIPNTTVAFGVDLDGRAIWAYIRHVLGHRKEIPNFQLLLHTAVHTVTTHLPQRKDVYSMNYLGMLLADGDHEDRVVPCEATPSSGIKSHVVVTPPSSCSCFNRSFSRTVLSPDIIAELLLGEGYARVRRSLMVSGSQMYLFLPIADDCGHVERQEELFSALRLSCAADRFAELRQHRIPSDVVSNSSAVLQSDSTTGVRIVNAPPMRLGQMFFHDHRSPPIVSSLLPPSETTPMERPYSFGTVAVPSSRAVKEECSLTSERWWTRHVVTFKRPSTIPIFTTVVTVPIVRIPFHLFIRTHDVPFHDHLLRLVSKQGLPEALSRQLASAYSDAITTVLEEMVTVVSQPPEHLHPHKQILFLLNLCSALERLQCPWRAPLRDRITKLILNHLPRSVVVCGIKSGIIPAELDEVLHSFRHLLPEMSPFLQRMLSLASQGTNKMHELRARMRERLARQLALRQSQPSSTLGATRSASESGLGATQTLEEDDDSTTTGSMNGSLEGDADGKFVSRRQRTPTDYYKRRSGGSFGQVHRSRGWMACAESSVTQLRYCMSNSVFSSSTHSVGASQYDDFDKQHAMLDIDRHSTMQSHRNQLPLDGRLPDFQPLRSFVNWSNATGQGDAYDSPETDPTADASDGETASTTSKPTKGKGVRMIATMRGIQRPSKDNPLMLERDMSEFKRRIAAVTFRQLLAPLV